MMGSLLLKLILAEQDTANPKNVNIKVNPVAWTEQVV